MAVSRPIDVMASCVLFLTIKIQNVKINILGSVVAIVKSRLLYSCC